MRMGQGVRTGLGHRGITCVLQTQFSSYIYIENGILCVVIREHTKYLHIIKENQKDIPIMPPDQAP